MPLRKSEIRETGEGQIEVVVEYEIRRVFHKRQGIPVMIFKDSDAIDYTKEKALYECNSAKACLERFKENKAKKELMELISFIHKRKG